MVVEKRSLSVRGLSVSFPGKKGWIKILDEVDMDFVERKFTAIVGESGCGKSVLGQAILGILPDSVRRGGNITFGAGVKNKRMGIIPQNPADSLNPTRRICKQMQDLLDTAGIEDKDNVRKKRYLELFHLSDTDRVLQSYPHELSGGMLQRTLCAMAASVNPDWILADEPTKGLDERTGALVIENLRRFRENLACSMIIITHDINLAKDVCDTVVVMYSGQIVEVNDNFFAAPLHPYSQGFLRALPQNGLHPMPGKAPDFGEEIQGCRFAPRCPQCSRRCLDQRPDLYGMPGGKYARCFLYA